MKVSNVYMHVPANNFHPKVFILYTPYTMYDVHQKVHIKPKRSYLQKMLPKQRYIYCT